MTAIFESEFDTNSSDFNWQDVLDWEVPETDCPEWSHSLVSIGIRRA